MDGLLTKDGITFISSPLMERAGPAAHGFLTRVKGLSPPPFDSMNLDEKGGDSAQNVRQNRALLAKAFGLPESPLTVTQVHGCGVHVAVWRAAGRLAPTGTAPEADAIVTNEKGVAIGVLTADCLPILLYDPVRRAAAAVHAGWRGTVKGVCLKAVEALEKTFGTRPADIVAALGPRIGQCCYGVGDEVLDAFRGAFGNADGYFQTDARGIKNPGESFGVLQGRDDKLPSRRASRDQTRDAGIKNPGASFGVLQGSDAKLPSRRASRDQTRDAGLRLDLAAANADQLLSAGLSPAMVATEAPCTSCNRDLFFSYRRDGARTGRQLSFIML